MNLANYRPVVKKFVAALKRKGVDLRSEWFQQDGATPHTATATLEMLRENFGQRVISLKTDFNWAPHSPDLNPLDFFLWGHLKNRMYANSPETLADLKAEIKRVMANVTPDMCQRTLGNFIKRLKLFSEWQGGHFEELL